MIKREQIDVCYHHNDPDGWASAAIISAPKNVGLGYKTKLNNSAMLNIVAGKTVAIVDFSFPEEVMDFIIRSAKEVLWIDHHEDSEYLKKLELPGIHDTRYAACRLCWDYFFPNEVIPDAIKFIADRDIWVFEYPETEAYNQGLNVLAGANNPASPLWGKLLSTNELTAKIVEYGQIGVNMIEENNLWHGRLRVHLVTQGDDQFIITNGTSQISELAAYLTKNFKIDKVLVWDIAKGSLGLHGRGKGVKDFFGGLLKGHPEACGGSIELPEGWKFLEDLYSKSRRITP